MLLYKIVRPFATLSFYAFYRKIYLTNTERIPKDKPVIIAANHPTAFLEPCILACFLPRPLHFLVRGDLFLHPFYNKMLRSLNLLPVFRLKDAGYGKLKNNYETFSYCYNALAANKTIMILAEGRTKQTKRLGALQKGSARLAIGALEQMEEIDEVYVVPVGVNFTYANLPRTEVLIDFGEPILASDYWEAYQENANRGISMLTDELYERLQQNMVIIEDEQDDQLVEHLHQMLRSGQDRSSPPVVSREPAPLELEQNVARMVNEMNADKKTALLQQTEDYFEHLQQFGLDDRAIAGKDFNRNTILLMLIIGFPFQLIGEWWNYLPAYIGKKIAREQVKQLEFKLPVRWGVSLGSFLVYLIIWLIVAAVAGSWLIIALVVVLFLLGYYHLHYQELKERYQKSRRVREIPEKQIELLRNKRAHILDSM